MSYTIHYGPDRPVIVPKKRNYMALTGAVFIVMFCAMVVGWALPQQAQRFAQALFPWTREFVQSAFTELRQDVQEGQSLSDAVTTFCREIIHHAGQMP